MDGSCATEPRVSLPDGSSLTHRRWAVVLLAAGVLAPGSGRAGSSPLPVRSAAIQVDAGGDVYVVNPDSDSAARLSPVAAGTQTLRWESAVGAHPRTLTV